MIHEADACALLSALCCGQRVFCVCVGRRETQTTLSAMASRSAVITWMLKRRRTGRGWL